MRAAAILLLLLGLSEGATAQVLRACPAALPGAASVYIDSTTRQVIVTTSGGVMLAAAHDLLLCPGDEVLTGSTGRVAIRFDQKRTIVRLDGNSRAQILSGGAGEPDIRLLSGVLYFLSSVRRHFEVDTPYIAAGIDGTEALMTVRPEADLAMAAVREGLVAAYDHAIGSGRGLRVAAGEAAFRSALVPFQSAPIGSLPSPFRELLIASDAAVDWAVYYPPILLLRDASAPAIGDAILLLSSGDYDKAEAALEAASNAGPAPAASLRTIIAIGRGRLTEAERWSKLALETDRNFAPAHVAASYVRQANGDLEGALRFAEAAVRLNPRDSYAAARVAELQMLLGDRLAALSTAERSLSVERTPLALFVAGLAHLAAWQYEQADAHFREAIARDPEAPLPRLGLGLLYIKQGDTAAGAWELERAVAHDPKRASLRTWLGRAYFEEGLKAKAMEELRIAIREDPDDPTPYLFSATQLFYENRPIPALHALQEAELHGRARATVRSEAGLSEDTAARGAAISRTYDVLAFDQLTILEGAEAVDADPGNPAAHRSLADAYRTRPGHEVAQTSELLRSQLLNPPSKTPVQPELAEAHLALLDTAGSTRVTFAEFGPLFDADGVRFDASGLVGTQDTWSDTTALTALHRGVSASVGQYHYETEGYRENNDLEHDIFNAIGTFALTPELTILGEYRRRESEGGDRRLNFDLETFDPTFRSEVVQEVARIGFHAQPTYDSDLLGVFSGTSLDTNDRVSVPGLGDIISRERRDATSTQLQYMHQSAMINSVSGGAYIQSDVETDELVFGSPSFNARTTRFGNAYTYFYGEFPTHVSWTLGGSLFRYDDSSGSADVAEFHPKLGVVAELTDNISLRAAYLQTGKADLVAEQLIEPTQVAGFNQFYDALNGSILEQVGAGLDLHLNKRSWIGAEAILRWWEVPPVGAIAEPRTREEAYRGYAYFLLSEDLALAAEVLHERSDSNVPFDFAEWQTTSVPIALNYFGESGVFGTLGAELVNHSFSNPGRQGSDRFALFHASLGYRIPGNRGIVSVEAQNIFDTEFNFQNRSIRPDLTAAPRYAPSRTIWARGTFRF
jgi:tetratricopeptide (TPR) repeat protein